MFVTRHSTPRKHGEKNYQINLKSNTNILCNTFIQTRGREHENTIWHTTLAVSYEPCGALSNDYNWRVEAAIKSACAENNGGCVSLPGRRTKRNQSNNARSMRQRKGARERERERYTNCTIAECIWYDTRNFDSLKTKSHRWQSKTPLNYRHPWLQTRSRTGTPQNQEPVLPNGLSQCGNVARKRRHILNGSESIK